MFKREKVNPTLPTEIVFRLFHTRIVHKWVEGAKSLNSSHPLPFLCWHTVGC